MEKTKAKKYLSQIKKFDKMILNKEEEKMMWRELAMGRGISLSERVQTSPNKSKMEDSIIKSVDLEAEIDLDIQRLRIAKKKIQETIELLDADECDLLYQVYVLMKPLKVATIDMGHIESWGTTVHGRALKHIQEILDERDKINAE